MTLATLLDRPIAFQRVFVSLGAGVTGALMLSQALYWTKRAKDDGWFYKTQSEWEEETGLTRYEQESARSKLKKIGVLEEVKKGLPCKLFYRVNLQVLAGLLFVENHAGNQQAGTGETSTPVCGKPADRHGENYQAPIYRTKTTTETTTLSNDDEKNIDDAFEVFWCSGMVKTGKKSALAKFRSIVKKNRLNPHAFSQKLANDVNLRLSAKQFGFDRMHPTTYLNQERWTDEVVIHKPETGGRPSINDFEFDDNDFAGIRRA